MVGLGGISGVGGEVWRSFAISKVEGSGEGNFGRRGIAYSEIDSTHWL